MGQRGGSSNVDQAQLTLAGPPQNLESVLDPLGAGWSMLPQFGWLVSTLECLSASSSTAQTYPWHTGRF